MKKNNIYQFDENEYISLIKKANNRFKFVDITEFNFIENSCIWRHDVDISPQRAKKLAYIESDLGIRSHFYVLFESRFYNLLEPKVINIIKEIANLGHHIGLHFDSSNLRNLDSEVIDKSIKQKKEMLDDIIGCEIKSLSIHDPDKNKFQDCDNELLGGLINASASRLRKHFTYCSDSNGYWRFRSLKEVIDDTNTKSLYALTHPEWWIPEAGWNPTERVKRAIFGRAESVLDDYQLDLKLQGRGNL